MKVAAYSRRQAVLRNGQQFHLKNERCVRRNRAGVAFAAVGFLRWNGEPSFLADFERGHAFVPALNDLRRAKDEGKRFVSVNRTVEFNAAGQPASVMDC